jgi:signal transduction histidine kinase
MASTASSNLNFAQEVRMDRLDGLWKLTLAGVGVAIWAAFFLSALRYYFLPDLILPALIIVAGCLATRALLRRERYETAVWAYVLTLIGGFSLLMAGKATNDTLAGARVLVPFLFPLAIVMVGLLLPTRSTLIALGLCVLITLVVPAISRGSAAIDGTQFFAVVLMCLAAGLAVQTSGELYGIAEWALDSFRKERTMKDQLFDSQQELQRSFMRQKALADQLQRTNQELEAARAAAMEAKNFRGQFLANMSHELRTPLNAIIGFSETMLNFPVMYDDETLPTAYRADMTQIYTSGKHLLQLINDILDLSKVDAGKLEMESEEVDLEPVIKAVLATAVGLVGDKPIQIKRDTAGQLAHVLADPLRLRQVILNLLSNAAKFTDTGSITLGVRDHGNGEMLIWVKDTGIGIPPQDLDTIFEEFRQGTGGRRKGRAGSGLGLAISRQLINMMNGRIWVDSKVGAGSTFYFTLPVFAAKPETVETAR